MDNIPVLLEPVSNNISDILIACLGVDSSLISSNSKYSIESFNDECVCIARLLSVTDKCVYFIVSNSVGEYIIPLVHQHRCIEQIYIYCSDENQRNSSWISRFQKITGCWTDYDLLRTKIYGDIKSILSQSSPWPNIDLIERCHTQTLISSSKGSMVALDVVNVEKYSNSNKRLHIVVLHCDNCILFHTDSRRFQLWEFSDVVGCVQHLEQMDVSSVFFIVSGEVNSIIHDLKTITMLKQIYAIYLFVSITEAHELDETILSYKNIGKLFDNLELLLNCLSADIKFYLEQPLYSPILYVFPSHENTKIKNKMGLTESQENFAAFHLFVNHFREAPTTTYRNRDLYDCCFTLVENKLDGEHALKILKTNKEQIFDWFVNVPFLSVIMNSLLQEQLPRNLLNIQQVLVAIDPHFAQVTLTISSSIVYWVQFLRKEDLKIIKANTNELITFHTYIFATKDLLTARTIARQATHRGLSVILFQIEVPLQTHVLELDNNRVMFRFGTIFRIQSINVAPDAVWYAELKHADSDFQSIEERLQLQMGEQLTWLTLGNYLCVLNHFDDAKDYFNYLTNSLPKDHKALPAIYNNIGLMFTELGDDEQALKYYDLAENLINTISSNTADAQQRISFKTLSQSSDVGMTVDCCTLYDKMAEVHLRQSEPEEALKYYRKALKLATDPLSRVQFEQKIKNTLSVM
jgi:tetratricopeptide (TPR) repeat protein